MTQQPAAIRRPLMAALIALVSVLPGAPAQAQTGDVPAPLVFFEPVRGALNAANPVDEWTLEGYAGLPIALLARGEEGLDPMLEVIAPDGTLVAENDDLDSLVRDAGFEVLALPDDGAYTVRVRRYEGARGASAGRYELLALPGFADLVRRDTFDTDSATWTASGDGSLALAGGGLRLRAAENGGAVFATPTGAAPLRDLYFQAEARLSDAPSYAEFGLVVRIPASQAVAGAGYLFKVNTAGQWSVSVNGEFGEFTLQEWSAAPALDDDAWTLGVLAQGTTLTFYANGARLGSVVDGRLVGAGAVALVAATRAGQQDPAAIVFDQVVITRRLGTTYRGLPLALTAWAEANPARVVAELAESGRIVPAPAHDLYVDSRALDAADPASRFEFVGSERALYGDFLLGASVVIVTDGTSPGCGILFRAQDDRNLSLAYVDGAGGFGLVRAVDGALTTNVYDRIPLNQPNPDRLLLLAQGDQVTLYINGALVAQETLGDELGRVGVALLNYEDVVTRCVFGDMWVWTLDKAGAGDE